MAGNIDNAKTYVKLKYIIISELYASIHIVLIRNFARYCLVNRYCRKTILIYGIMVKIKFLMLHNAIKTHVILWIIQSKVRGRDGRYRDDFSRKSNCLNSSTTSGLPDVMHQDVMHFLILNTKVTHGNGRGGVVVPLTNDLKPHTMLGTLNVPPCLSQCM
jgi:hypothetical protein